MTNRDRLFAVLDGRPADRVPIWLLFPYHRLPYYADVRTNPRYRSVVEASRERAVLLDRRSLRVALYGPDVTRRREVFVRDGWDVERDSLECGDVRLFSETCRRGSEVRLKKLLESEDDLRAYGRLPFNTDARAIRRELEEQLPAYLAERAEFPAECGATMLDLGEPIGPLYFASDLNGYPVWSLTQGEAVAGLLDRLQERCRAVYDVCLEHDLAEVYFLVGSELASPPLVSRATFQRWIVPYARELIERIHRAGRKVIQHYHGRIREILPDFLTMGPDGLHTIEAPPTGDCTLREAFGVVGDAIALIGNVQYDRFRSATPAEMRREVRDVLDEGRGRRLILSPTAGPYEDAVDETVIRNYHEFLNAGWEDGRRERDETDR